MGALALYLHWPFCAALCPYCDFNSHVAPPPDEDRWAAAFELEIARHRALTGPRALTSVFFGGGTPSLMSPRLVARILRAADRAWGIDEATEITLEANPTSSEASRFRGYREAGVNRLSIGVQSLIDADLKRLGRLHSAAEALQTIDIANQSFDRTSFDLIYARQDQTPEAWKAELEQALALNPSHLSLYQLTIEPGTAFGARHAAGKLPGLPDDDRAADLWHLTQDVTQAHGLPAYEISNHARPGAEGRHNLTYWRCGDWAGIGPGAHGRLTLEGRRMATETPLAPGKWLHAAETGRATVHTPEDDPAETLLMMGLRLREGVDLARYEALGGPALPRLPELVEDGLLERDGRRLRLTEAGRPLLNAVLARLVVG